MKTNIQRLMKVITLLVIFFGVLNIVIMLVQAESAVGIWSEERLAEWDESILWLQIGLLIGRTLFGIVLNILSMVFMLHSIKLMRCGEFFSKRNVVVLWCSVPAYIIFSFCSGNMNVVYGERLISINSDTFFVSLLLIGVALIYSTGVRLSEENRLTV